MNAVVIYYSYDGATKVAAEEIAKEIDADLIELKIQGEKKRTGFPKMFLGGMNAIFGKTPRLEQYDFDKSKYDTILLGTPIWASRQVPAVNTFLRDNNLQGKDIYLFACSGGEGGANSYFQDMRDKYNIKGVLGLSSKDTGNKEAEVEKIMEFARMIQNK